VFSVSRRSSFVAYMSEGGGGGGDGGKGGEGGDVGHSMNASVLEGAAALVKAGLDVCMSCVYVMCLFE